MNPLDQNDNGVLNNDLDRVTNDTNAPAEPGNDAHATSTAAPASGTYEPNGGVFFHGGATPDGTEYSTPNGGHGYAYAPLENERKHSKRGRHAWIAVTVVAVALLLLGSCFLGGWAAANFLLGDSKGSWLSGRIPDPSDGLSIAGDGESESDGQQENTGETNTFVSVVPENATIIKSETQRPDADGDGRADVIYGSDGEVLTSAGENVKSIATVVAEVADAVVEITTETMVQSSWIGQYVTGGAGSGVIISKEGFIVTNHHVVDGANTISVRLTDGSEYPAVLIGTDEQSDIAVLWIDAGDTVLTVAELGCSHDLVVGEPILAIGNPLGSLGGTVTEGIVSATAREITVDNANMTLLQVSAPINPGNSGGALFNMAGHLVGIVNAKMSSEEIEGLGFAIPIDTAYEVIMEIIDHGYVSGRPALGFTVVDVTSVQTAMYYFGSRYTGVYVYDDDHPVVAYGDRILTADGVEIADSTDLAAVVSEKSVGDTLELVVYRNREQITLTITIIEKIPSELNGQAVA